LDDPKQMQRIVVQHPKQVGRAVVDVVVGVRRFAASAAPAARRRVCPSWTLRHSPCQALPVDSARRPPLGHPRMARYRRAGGARLANSRRRPATKRDRFRNLAAARGPRARAAGLHAGARGRARHFSRRGPRASYRAAHDLKQSQSVVVQHPKRRALSFNVARWVAPSSTTPSVSLSCRSRCGGAQSFNVPSRSRRRRRRRRFR
jgi:hypothetical protein